MIFAGTRCQLILAGVRALRFVKQKVSPGVLRIYLNLLMSLLGPIPEMQLVALLAVLPPRTFFPKLSCGVTHLQSYWSTLLLNVSLPPCKQHGEYERALFASPVSGRQRYIAVQ